MVWKVMIHEHDRANPVQNHKYFRPNQNYDKIETKEDTLK